jgi:MerR family transcriptional regulator, thiopeptide resistance regulator
MFTVKQLSHLAGITPRALHYYDEIGLLKPTRVGDNGYRYYGEDALVRLQQVLLYRELGMPLEQIVEILDRPDFDVQESLHRHRGELLRRIHRLETLVKTVDQTIEHMKGKTKMEENKFFTGFSEEQQAAYEKEAMDLYDHATVKASNARWKAYTAEQKQSILDEAGLIYQEYLAAMPAGPDSPAAQAAVAHWRKHMNNFWSPNDEQLLGLADLYNDDPRFKANYDRMQPGLAEFVREAVRVYVEGRK